MEEDHERVDIPLSQQSSSLSDYSFGSKSTIIASPESPNSLGTNYEHGQVSSTCGKETPHHIDSTFHSSSKTGHGLGITHLSLRKRGSLKGSQGVPGSADTLLSPISASLSGVDGTDDETNEGSSYNHTAADSYEGFTVDSDRDRLQKKANDMDGVCQSRRPLATGRGSWTAISILALSIYSTVFSGIWLCIAFIRPRFPKQSAAGLTLKDAGVICTALARSIEISFATVFVVLIGQVLSTRAIGTKKSVTLAEILMRSWVVQPGNMLTHWESVRYAVNTWLGKVALLVAVLVMLFTTASDALVAPNLNVVRQPSLVLQGRVITSFANTSNVNAHCTTPITETLDPGNAGSTCSEIQHSGQAYHNYMQYLADWVQTTSSNYSPADMSTRPSPRAMLYDNTTVDGSWTNVYRMASLSEQFNNRIVNNVTMAMPHPGVVAAAKDPLSPIEQLPIPDDLYGDDGQSQGSYYIRASVPSPVVNVLCAELTAEEMKPMIYKQWPSEYVNDLEPSTTTWPDHFDLTMPDSQRATAVDDLFGFEGINAHPIFPKWPLPSNTLFNSTGPYGRQSVYLLAIFAHNISTLCSIRAALSSNCSTSYLASTRGGSLWSNCEDKDDALAYHRSNSVSLNGIWSMDWRDVAHDWGLSLALNDGIMDGMSANARLLTQLIPTSNALDPLLPSISEALAVLAGSALLLSAMDTPFDYGGNLYPGPLAKPDPGYQPFNASLLQRYYASGAPQSWQQLFFVVLILVFILNLCCLAYFLRHGGHVTDYVEPDNLFCLSLLSYPNKVLAGACGGGPDRKHFNTKWNIKLNEEQGHLSIESYDDENRKRWSRRTLEHELSASDVAAMYYKIRRKPTSML